MIQTIKTFFCRLFKKHTLYAHPSDGSISCSNCGHKTLLNCKDFEEILTKEPTSLNWDNWAFIHPRVEGKSWPGVCPVCQPQAHNEFHRHDSFASKFCRCSITLEDLK